MTLGKLFPAAGMAALSVALWSALPLSSAFAANTVIYRCLDARLEVVYTDLPCKDGASFEVRPGDADPARRCAVRLTSVTPGNDPVGGAFETPATTAPVGV